MTTPKRRKSLSRKKTSVHKTVSNESKESRGETTTSDTSQRSSLKTKTREEGRYIKAEVKSSPSQGAIKKKLNIVNVLKNES